MAIMGKASCRPRSAKYALPLLAALLTGCIRVEQNLTLNADGSGTMDFTYGLSEENIAQIEAFTSGADPAGNGAEERNPIDFTDEEIREEFKQHEAHGVVLESVSTEMRDGWKYKRLVIRFRNLDGLSQTGLLPNQGTTLTRDAGGNYVFSQSAAGQQIPALPADAEGSQINAMITNLMKGFRAVVRVNTPGAILDSNASEKAERTATWTYDFEKNPNALEEMQKASLRVVFDGSGLVIPEIRGEREPGS